MAIRPFECEIDGIQFLGGLFYVGPAGQEEDIFHPLMLHVSEMVEQWLLSLAKEERKMLAGSIYSGFIVNNELEKKVESVCQDAMASAYASIGHEHGGWRCCLSSVYFHPCFV